MRPTRGDTIGENLRGAAGRALSMEGEMFAWRSQRGEIQVGCIIGAIILLLAVVLAMKAVPAMLAVGDLQAEIVSQAEKAGIPRYSNEVIHQRLMEKVRELELPVEEENIKIKRTKRRIIIVVEYELELNFVVYTYLWQKRHEVERSIVEV